LDFSIIIVNYRGWKALDECLASIEKLVSLSFPFEVIVIDNYSNDGKLKEFKQKFLNFIFVENSGNNGFSNGSNCGAKIAKGDYFLFLNPDTKVTSEALKTLLHTAVSHPEIGILSCLQIDENNTFYNQNNLFPAFGSFFGISRFFYRKFNKKKLNEKFYKNEDLFFPDWVSGALIFISREWFERIDGWNEDYWLYFEDVDICKKMAKKGGKIAVTQKTTIFHLHGGASRINIKTKALTKTEVIISKHTYINNHFLGSRKIILHSLLIIGVLSEKLILAFLGIFLFFIPRLKVNLLMLKNISNYYLKAIKKLTWISPRAMNYLKPKV